jgi:hypothetical protein
MRKGSEPGPALAACAAAGEATQTSPGRDPVSRSRPDDLANPSPDAPTEVVPPHAPTEVVPPHAPTEVVPPHAPTEVVPPHAPTGVVGHGPGVPPPAGQAELTAEGAWPADRPQEVVRYGPGVPATPPAGQAELTAERVWRASRPAKRSGRSARLLRLSGWALTVILLAASGVLLFLRFHHAPFHVTGVVISQQTQAGCGVDVTGRISTNGSAGTVSYQWLFRPGLQPPQPLSQSAVAGQHAVNVTVAVQGTGHGSSSRTVTLQVVGPDLMTASTAAVVSC